MQTRRRALKAKLKDMTPSIPKQKTLPVIDNNESEISTGSISPSPIHVDHKKNFYNTKKNKQ